MAPTLVSENVFRVIVDAENPPGIAAEIPLIETSIHENADCVFLEGVQDSGNVGAIIRSAAAFGVRNMFIDRACADPWSPKVLRASMGGHFMLSIIECRNPPKATLVCTVPRDGTPLKEADLSGPLCWVFGSEGKGVSPALQEKAALRVTIPVAAGMESLNVAAAAAICFCEAFSRRGRGS